MSILAFASNNILDSTSAGRALLTAANASVQRTLLGLSSSSPVSFLSLVLSGQNLTGSQATGLIDSTSIWNTTGTPIAWKLNVTDTASNASSLLVDLQVGSVTQFSVRKDGRVAFKNNTIIDQNGSIFCTSLTLNGGKADLGGTYLANTAQFKSNYGVGWNSGDANTSNVDTLLYRDSAGIIAQRNGVNAQSFRVYNTYTDASNYERAKISWESNALIFGTEAAGTGVGRQIQIYTGGVKKLIVGSGGAELAFGTATVPPSIYAMNWPFSGSPSLNGPALGFRSDVDISNTFSFLFSGNPATITSGTSYVVQIERQFNPTSGTGSFAALYLRNIINQTGGSTGITRGLYVNPYFFSAADWRSIETSNNTGWAIYAAGTANSFFNGNVGIGTTSPTVKLDIAGTLEVKNGLSPQNIHIYNTYTNPSNYERARIGWESNALIFGAESAGTGALREIHIYTNGNKKLTVGAGGAQLSFGSNAAPPLIYAMSWPFYGDASLSGQGLGFRSDVNDPNTQGFVFGGNPASITSGALSVVQIERSFLPTSGTGVFNAFRIRCSINQTGGANGITRGIFINPTLTSAADWRAIEITAGKTIVAPSTTTSASLNIPSGTAPTSPVDGDIWFDGTALKIRIGGVTKTVTVT